MKEKIFINARIIDPSQSMDEKGSLILNDKGKVKAIGKNVKKTDANKDAEIIDLKDNILIPGLVDMKAFVGEPGYEYKENFRTLSQAALAGGVTSIVTMPNTKPIIDNVSMVDFIIRRGRDKANVNLFPCASITKQCEGKLMTEFGLLSGRGIIGFSDVNKTIQNTELMSRIMDYASDIGVLIMQHAEDYELSKNACINDGEIATRLGLQGISALAEKIIIERDLSLLSEYPCRYHINQISSKQSLDVIRKNKNNGKKFSVGVSINNLSLNENDIGVLIMQHVEDYELSKNACINDGEIATRLGLQGVSALAEKIIIERDLSLLSEYPCKYHINQISSKQSLDVIRKNKDNGKKFSVGVSINNLSLNENDIGEFKTFLKLSPPLRLEEDRLSLVQGIKDGLIDVIVSDHLPEDEESKRLPFSQAATGAIGVETLLPLSLEMYHNESLPLKKIIETLTINPAKILNIKKGTLVKGSDGDICIFDLEAPWKVNADKLKSKSKNTAVESRNLQGKILMTYLNGELVYSN